MSGAAYDIRCAGLGELGDAAALYERVATATLPWQKPGTHTIAGFLQQSENETVWVAVADGAVIGLAALYEPESFLHSLFVDFAWQNRGIGKALLDIVAEAAEAPLSLKVEARNHDAVRFYHREGFHIVELGETDGSQWLRLARGAV